MQRIQRPTDRVRICSGGIEDSARHNEPSIRREGLSPSCRDCAQAPSCYPATLSHKDVSQLSSLMRPNRKFQSGDVLLRAGSPLTRLLFIKSGSVKSCAQSRGTAPEERVVAFHFAGEVLGLDGVAECRYQSSARALEAGICCEISTSGLDQVTRENPQLQNHLLRLTSQGLVRANSAMRLVTHVSGTQRLGAFLLDTSVRLESLGLSATELRLAMSRAEIASFLGMAPETISRLLGRLQDAGLVAVEGKQIRLLSRARLQASIEEEGRDKKAVVRTLNVHPGSKPGK